MTPGSASTAIPAKTLPTPTSSTHPAPAGQLALVLLPDLPGLVHGIVQVDPFVRIQCDGCGFIYDGEPGKVAFGVILSGILFCPRRYQNPQRPDRRRLCRSCRAVEWGEAE